MTMARSNQKQSSRPQNQSGTGGTQATQQNQQQNSPQQTNQTTEGSPSAEELLNNAELKEAYNTDGNFTDEPRWDELTDSNRATYARLLGELDADGDEATQDDDSQDDGAGHNSTDGGRQEPGNGVQAAPLSNPTPNAVEFSATELSAQANQQTFNPVGEPDGKIIEQGDPLTFDADEINGMIVVSRDVYRRVVPFRARRPTYILVMAKGTIHAPGSVTNNDDPAVYAPKP